MDILNITEAVAQPWTRVYVRILALVLMLGGMVHVGNILGLNGVPWTTTPFHLRLMDVVLLVFNIIVALGLWLRRPWAVVAFAAGIVVFQVVPYTLFRQYFIQRPEDDSTLTGLVATVSLLLGVLIVLILTKK